MTLSIRLNDQDSELIKNFAALHGISVSELIRQTVLARIEDEIDIQAYQKAMAEHQADPTTYTHEEIAKMLELDK